jgi:hypothetical protein
METWSQESGSRGEELEAEVEVEGEKGKEKLRLVDHRAEEAEHTTDEEKKPRRRFLIVTIGTRGDLQPYVALGTTESSSSPFSVFSSLRFLTPMMARPLT